MAPVYQRQVDPRLGGIAAPQMRGVSGAAIGLEAIAGALRQSGQAFSTLGEAERRRLDLAGRSYDLKAIPKARLDATVKLRELIDAAEPGAAGLRDSVRSSWAETRRRILDQAPKGYDRSGLERSLDDLAVEIEERADAFERAARADLLTTQAKEGLDLAQATVFTDPSQYDKVRDSWRAGIAALDLPAPVKHALEREGLQGLADHYIQGLTDKDPPKAAAMLRRGELPELSAARRPMLLARAEAEQERRQADQAQAEYLRLTVRTATDPYAAWEEINGLAPEVEFWQRIAQRLESGDDPHAVNTQTATGEPSVGAMQLQPGTARETAKKMGLPDVAALKGDALKDALKLNVDLNVKLGTHYLAQQLAEFGDPALALAAYNAGPGKVREWLKEYGDPRTGAIALTDWLDRIYPKTRDYVREGFKLAGKPPTVGTDPMSQVRARAWLDNQRAVQQLDAISAKQARETRGEAAGDQLFMLGGGIDGSLTAMLDAARGSIEDPVMRDIAAKRINDRWAEAEKARQADQGQAFRQVMEQVEQGLPFTKVPPGLLVQMGPDNAGRVRDRARQLAKREEPETDPDLYLRLRNLPPQDFAKVDLLQARPYLSDADFKGFVDQQAKVRSGETGAMRADLNGQIADTAAAVKLTDKAALGRFSSEVWRAVAEEEQRTGKTLSFLETQQIVDRLVTVIDKPWFGRNPRFFEMPGAEDQPLTREVVASQTTEISRATGIPAEHLPPLVNELESQGLPITWRNLTDLWRELHEPRRLSGGGALGTGGLDLGTVTPAPEIPGMTAP